ncbi:MAG: lysylphosphatidylglycerol synthase transmembrane domain-containing protein [Phototrophicaceae bacterium]
MRKYRNQILLGILIAIGIYIGLLLFADSQGRLETDGIIEAIQSFPLYLIPILILAQTAVIFFRFLEWHYYLGVIDARHRISLLDSIIIFVASFMMVVSPGKAAELLKSVMLKIRSAAVDPDPNATGVPIAKSAPIVIAERVIDGIAVLILMTVTLVLAGDQLNLGTYQGIDYGVLSRGLIYSSSAIILAGLIIIQIKPLAYFFLNLLRYIPLLKKLQQPLTDFYESSREIFALKHVILVSIIGLGVYVSSAAGFIVVLYGFGLDITYQLILQALFIVGVASAIGALSFVPNGAGVTEISNTGMLIALVAPIQPIVTLPIAAAAALIQGFFHKWFRVVVGLMVAVIYHNRLFNDDLETELADAEHHKKPKTEFPQSAQN